MQVIILNSFTIFRKNGITSLISLFYSYVIYCLRAKNTAMKIIFLGHATFLVEIGSTKILFDPFISSNPLAKDIDIDIDSIKTDYILISHGHLDHVEDLERIYKNQEKCTLISNYEITAYYKNKGLSRIHPIMPGGKWKFHFGTVYAVEEAHSSSMPDGTYGGVPMGFVIETDTTRENLLTSNELSTINNINIETDKDTIVNKNKNKNKDKTFYFAGDTGLHLNMKLIADFHTVDFAILPIGGNFTMDIEQAMVATDFINTNKVIAMHYDTNDFIKVNKNAALNIAKSKNKKLIFMDIGESLEF